MRKELAKNEGERKTFRAVFKRIGKKVNFKGYSEETLLLSGVTDVGTGKVVADHVWFSFTKGFERLSLKEGRIIEFDARIKSYKKGYVNKGYGINRLTTDYKLSHPTKIRLVE